MDLPNVEYTFHFKDKGERTKKTFEGSFTVKAALKISELQEVGFLIDVMNRGSRTLPPGTMLLNRSLAELDVRVIKSPSWWKDSDNGRNLLDPNIVLGVFDQAMEGEKVFDERMEKAGDEAEGSIKESAKKKKEA